MLNPCDTAFLETLAALLPPDTLRPPAPRYLEEPRGLWQGQAGAVALPRSTEEVAVIVRAAAQARVGLVPYGGGTALVGGQVMPDGPLPLILSLERMNRLREVSVEDAVLVAEAGATLQSVQEAAAAAGRIFPLSLASEGTATIGGNLSTNAGGTAVLRYGNARELCLGLEAVLADGTIWHGLKRLRKDNTGYDLRGLLIGAEGTLGVITAATLRLFPQPAHRLVALLVVPSPKAAQELLALAEARLSGLVTAFELIRGTGLDFLAEVGPEVRMPFAERPDWSVLVELGLPQAMEPELALASLYEEAADAGLVLDGVIANSETQAHELWALRESIPEANRRIGAISSHDISLPLSSIPAFLTEVEAALTAQAAVRINAFGHLGDGNLHVNIFPNPGRSRQDYAAQRGDLQRLMHDLVAAMGGSISAEHGIGRGKVVELERYGDPARLAAMRAIKQALDPQGIMNPGAVLRLP
ncbi:FAD-binding oxidoreductase [Xinfangfangia sp. CPCC 101601]|uniref:FAD-binding oxidoreductase n=1 Tax=Pseudogemmobacter lacusdianii TaxID=3069608 RepID=A0ABU0VW18_9RHOB|nr:FAD-binding oxidoreductase [Xinfangfangia sp. CPCC 101601]MDQ2065828.1 FAD-binding oxidoreductase [Xinfangfangia sp. CPCC 101601]